MLVNGDIEPTDGTVGITAGQLVIASTVGSFSLTSVSPSLLTGGRTERAPVDDWLRFDRSFRVTTSCL